jgi:hypothetical protein
VSRGSKNAKHGDFTDRLKYLENVHIALHCLELFLNLHNMDSLPAHDYFTQHYFSNSTDATEVKRYPWLPSYSPKAAVLDDFLEIFFAGLGDVPGTAICLDDLLIIQTRN